MPIFDIKQYNKQKMEWTSLLVFTQVRRNVTDVSYHIAQYTNIIQELREEIQRLRHRLHDKSTGSPRPGVNIQAVQGTQLCTSCMQSQSISWLIRGQQRYDIKLEYEYFSFYIFDHADNFPLTSYIIYLMTIDKKKTHHEMYEFKM